MDGTVEENRPAAAPVAQAKAEPHPPAQSALVEEAERVAATLNEKLPPLSGEAHASGNYKAAPDRERETPEAREEADGIYGAHAAQPSEREESGAETAAAGKTTTQPETRGRIGRRAATVGATVGENLRPRVDKLREASTVVFDEATDDPGLRFVIIAALLFLLFLFIFLLNYILG